MIPASEAIQRPPDARLMVVDATSCIREEPRSSFVAFLRPGDLVVANDAATIPASLSGLHLPTGRSIEVRLAGRHSLAPTDVREFSAIVFGAGDFRTRTEDRSAPPQLSSGDQLLLGPLKANVNQLFGHPRLVSLCFQDPPDVFWAGIAHHGRPIQYSHLHATLAMWDVWTPIAGPPVAFEPPSAGFALDWQALAEMRAKGIGFATITHAAGISSTGDPELDLRLPFDEPYRISKAAALAIRKAKARGAWIVAIGTTVVRALEHAARAGEVRAGEDIATQRIGAESHLRLVDAILSGTHEPGTSHYELLRAFLDDNELTRVTAELNSRGYRTHEFGDSVLIVRRPRTLQGIRTSRHHLRT